MGLHMLIVLHAVCTGLMDGLASLLRHVNLNGDVGVVR